MRWRSARELSDVWRVPIGTVRRWASEDNWPRIPGYPVLYDGEKAEDSYARRKAGRKETLDNIGASHRPHGI
jgi:hypothetical protein